MQASCVLRPADTLQSPSECTRRCSSSSRRAIWGKSWCWTTFPSCWIACETATWQSAGWCCTLQTQVRLHAALTAELSVLLYWGFILRPEGNSVLLLLKSAVSSTVCRKLLSCCFANSLLKPCVKQHMHFLSSCEPNTGIKISRRSHYLVE